MRKCQRCGVMVAVMAERYPYRHHGPAVHGSKLADFLVSEAHMREDGLLPPDDGRLR